MNTKKTIKKILALGAGVTMVGATVMGAMAYDLASYPAPFVKDGAFDGAIVLGSGAAMADMLGAVDISTSLQASSVVKKTVEIPGQTGKVTLQGDNFKLATGSDALELREPIGDVVDTIGEGDLSGLKSGSLSTSEGDTDYQQYIRLKDASNLQTMAVNYRENDDNMMADYLVVDINKAFLEWEIQFASGFETSVDSTTRLTDLEDETLNIMGQDFSIVKADLINTQAGIEMTLMGGSSPATLREGETKTFTLDGVEYEVTLVFVSDPSSSSSDVEAKFMVNGEVTKALQRGDTATLSGGIQIGVRDILVNSRDGVASFYLGADKIVFSDANYALSDFTAAGNVEINTDSITEGDVEIAAQITSGTVAAPTKFEITSMKYRVTMDAEGVGTAYLPAGKGVKSLMRHPRALISDSLDLSYQGLEEVESYDVKIDARGDDRYTMEFTNIQGETYDFPLLSNENGVWKFGDNNYELVFIEASNFGTNTTFNIGRNDYFIVSNDRGTEEDKSVTNVLRYTSYDSSSRTVEFNDLATNTVQKAIVTAGPIGSGPLVIGGHTYTVYVDNTSYSQPIIAVDLNADNGAGDKVKVAAWGGMVIDLAVNVNNTAGTLLDTPALQATVVGNGKNIANDSATTEFVSMSYYIPANRFDSGTGNETFTWTVQPSGSSVDQIDMTTSENNYVGPAENSANLYTAFQLSSLDGDSDHKVGMTDYGVYLDHLNPSGNDDPDELTFSVPEIQRFAQVFVTMGDVSASEGGAGTVMTDAVNPIAVGLAVLDKDAPAFGVQNLIVVGGPCVNSVAAELLGNPTECAAGFTPGKAMIKSFEKTGKVAILVAGYSADDTVGASRVLANHGDYAAFAGSEVEIVVPDLTNIRVQAVTQ